MIIAFLFVYCLISSNYQEIVAHYFTDNIQNSCYLIHPWVKWGPNKIRDTNPQQQLEEAASLIRTLDPWRVYDGYVLIC